MATTENYGLYLTESESETFLDWRKKLCGQTGESSMELIDAALTDKEEKSVYSTATLYADNWVDNEDEETVAAWYFYIYDLEYEGALESTDSAECVIYPSSLKYSDYMCQTCDVFDDYIRFYSNEIPEGDIVIQIRLLRG